MTDALNSADAIASLLSRPDPIRWVFAGDSITHGSVHTFGCRDYTELFSERVRTELRRLRDVVIKTGVGGWTVSDLSADLEWSILQHRPAVLSIGVGMNDCKAGAEAADSFRENLVKLIADVRAVLPDVALILHTPPRILQLDGLRAPHLAAFAERICDAAEQTNAVLVDHFAAWRSCWEDGTLIYRLSDAIHPNHFGHRILANQLLTSIGLAASLPTQSPYMNMANA
jgi:lysophospholipase L1-like esterase